MPPRILLTRLVVLATFLFAARAVVSDWRLALSDDVAVRDTSRVGPLDLPGNASLTGTLAKAGVDSPALTVVWLTVGGLVVLAAFLQAEQCRRLGDHGAAAVILGCATIVASPISWPAHQIWLPLAGLVLAWRGVRRSTVMGVAVILFCYFHIPLNQWWDEGGVPELILDHLAFAMFTLICLVGLGLPQHRPSPPRLPDGGTRTAASTR